ncbi:MAG: hypothetical protein GOP50_08300 [Candidatus Heimdallarchaeota archaeon]|nr:hypothetical protein [Candidatus Heimdallarchaeota archaeon]
MSKKLRRVSNIRIYITQYAIFLLGGILFIAGIYMYDYGASVSEDPNLPDARGLEIAGFILLALGLIFIVLSYIYARTGARVIGTNCPLCHGTGYVDSGVKKEAKREVCSLCNGTGKMYDKGSELWEEEQKKQALSESEEQTKIE